MFPVVDKHHVFMSREIYGHSLAPKRRFCPKSSRNSKGYSLRRCLNKQIAFSFYNFNLGVLSSSYEPDGRLAERTLSNCCLMARVNC